MRTRIPTSLKWLAEKRARIASEVKQLEKRLKTFPAEIAAVEKALSAFRNDLGALDRVLALHEIRIDPETIPAIHSGKKALPLAHGHMTKLIHSYLRPRKANWSSTTEIATFVWVKSGSPGDMSAEFRLKVRHRLKCLARDDRIERTHPKGHWAEVFWRGKQCSGAMSSHKIS